jgi:hypothetical protein
MTKIVSRFSVFLIISILTVVVTPTMCAFQQDDSTRNHALLPESWARKAALIRVMPVYPEEVFSMNTSAVIQIKFETNSLGEVLRIKVKPGTDPVITKTIVDAVKQWKFKPWIGGESEKAMPVISKLSFCFIKRDRSPRIELIDPVPNAPHGECLGCTNSAKELRQWKEWEEAWTAESGTEP